MASAYPYAGTKEHFGLLTVYLWLSKSNSLWLYQLVNSKAPKKHQLINSKTQNISNSPTFHPIHL